MTKKSNDLTNQLNEAISVATSVAYTKKEIEKLKTELYSLLEKKSAETIVEYVQVPGPPGQRGLIGSKGDKGDKGDRGDAGPVGPKGDKGEVGPQGNMGLEGPRGLKGDKGDKGDTGAVGPQGEQGIQGIAGERGEKGEKGDRGADGKNGLDGRDGQTGAVGPAGSIGPQGVQGERGLKGDKGERGQDGQQGIQGPAGPRGEVGPQGVQGLPGKDGKDADIKPVEDKFQKFIDNVQKDVSAFKTKVNATILKSGPNDAWKATGSGEVNLRYLDDVDRDSITDGYVLSYDEASSKFVFVEQTGGGSTIDVYARTRANNAWYTANLAYTQANNAFATANTKSYTFSQNTAPGTANTNDFWANTDSGIVYYNFGNTASPIWVEFGPTGTSSGGTSNTDLTGYAVNTTVNLVWSTANSAYNRANTAYDVGQAAYDYANTLVLSGNVGTLQQVTTAGNTTTVGMTTTTLAFNLTSANTVTTGQMAWNAADLTVNVGMSNGVTLQLGQEQYIKIKAGEVISDGEAVMFGGADGEHIIGLRNDMSTPGYIPEWFIGVATQNFTLNQFGYVTVFGKVHGLNTLAFAEGDILYANPAVVGGLTNVEPSAPNYNIVVAAVTKRAGGDGHLLVRPTWRDSLSNLNDVQITSVSNNNLLKYNTANTRWENVSASSVIEPAYAQANTANSIAQAAYDYANTLPTSFTTDRLIAGDKQAVLFSANGALLVPGNVIPPVSGLFTLGDSTHKFADIWIGPNTINIQDQSTGNNAQLTIQNGTLFIDNAQRIQIGDMALTTNGISLVASSTSNNISVGALLDTGFLELRNVGIQFRDGSTQNTAATNIDSLARTTANSAWSTANTQSDWNVSDNTSVAFIKNKPTLVTTLDGLSDATIVGPLNEQVLTYNTATGQWINQSIGISANNLTTGYFGSFYYDGANVAISNTQIEYIIPVGGSYAGTNGITAGGNNDILFAHAGTYRVEYSIQFVNDGNADDDVDVWVKINGTNEANTNSKFSVVRKNTGLAPGNLIAVTPFLVTVNAGDRVQLAVASAEGHTKLVSYPAQANPNTPSTPAVIINAEQVASIVIPTDISGTANNASYLGGVVASAYARTSTTNTLSNTISSAWSTANSALSIAQSAFAQANTGGGGTSQLINGSSIVSLSNNDILTVPGPISGLGNSKLDFTTYGSNTAYLTTTSDDSTALFVSLEAAELYANTTVQIRTNTAGTSKNWTFGADGTLTFPDNTSQTTAFTGTAIDSLARTTANSAYTQANTAYSVGMNAYSTATTAINIGDYAWDKANSAFNKANTAITTSGGTANGSITANAATAFIAGSAAISGVALQIPYEGGIRNTYNGLSNMYLDVSTGGSTHGQFQFRSSSSFTNILTMSPTVFNVSTDATVTARTPSLGRLPWNSALDTELTIDDYRWRITNSGGIYAQVISNTGGTKNSAWTAVAAISGSAVTQGGSTGVLLPNNSWTTLYTFGSMANAGDTVTVTFQDKAQGRIYRVTFMRSDNGSTTGYNIIAERLL